MDRRADPRIKKRISCELEHGGRHHSGIVLDLSRSGLFVQTNAKPRPGSTVSVQISVPGRPQSLEVSARVARAKLVPPQLLNVAQGGVGLHIPEPTQAYLDFIEELANPPKIQPASVLESKPEAKKPPREVSKVARDRLAALRARSSGVRVKSSAVEGGGRRRKASAPPQRFRVRLQEQQTSVSRSFIVSCGSEDEARERVSSEMGDGWAIEGVDRI